MNSFYSDEYISKNDTQDLFIALTVDRAPTDIAIYFHVLSAIVIRASFFLIQVSCTPSINLQIIFLQYITEIGVTTITFMFFGHIFAFGKDKNGMIGLETFLTRTSDREDVLRGWVILFIVSGIVTVSIGDRSSFLATLILNFVVAGFSVPIIIHWVLAPNGWMRSWKLYDVMVSYKDYGYSCLIHMVGGFISLLWLLILQNRLLRLRDLDISSIPKNAPSLAIFGCFLMIAGFFGICIPNRRYLLTHLNFDFYGIVLLNLVLSCFGALLTSIFMTFIFRKFDNWVSFRCLQSGIFAVALVSGGVDLYTPMCSLLLGLCSGVLSFGTNLLVQMSPLEDYCNVVSTHFVGGCIGTLLPPIFGIREGFKHKVYYDFMHTIWQLVCSLVTLIFLTISIVPFLILMDWFRVLRTPEEDINRRRALSFSLQNQEKDSKEPSMKPQKLRTQGTDTPEFTPNDDKEPEEHDSQKKKGDYSSYEELNRDSFSKTMVNNTANDQQTRYYVNYLLNMKPEALFEEVASECSKKGDRGEIKEVEQHERSRIPIRLEKLDSLKKILSDSKLLRKFTSNIGNQNWKHRPRSKSKKLHHSSKMRPSSYQEPTTETTAT